MAALTKTTFVLLATIGAITARDIPEFLHICNINDPQYSNCVLESIEALKPYLKTGVPEFNIPSLEPLKLTKLSFAPTSSIQIQLNDINANGASNFIVHKVRADNEKNYYVVDVGLENILVDGKYDINGKVLLLPIRGSGPMQGNFSNCLGTAKVQGEKYIDKDGMQKIRIKNFKLKFSVGKGTLKLENLFGGEKALGDAVNNAINNNFDLFLKELMPIVEKGLSDAFQDIADNIVQQFSYEQLFPK